MLRILGCPIRIIIISALIILVGLVGCESKPPDSLTPSPGETSSPTPDQPTPTSQVDTALTPGGAILPPGPVTLDVWTIQKFAAGDQDPGARQLLNQLLAFDRNHADVAVQVTTKRPTGPGGIMEYLHTASQVAPAVLPDLVILSSEMLAQAMSEGVLQDLGPLLGPEVMESLFPVADELGRIDGALMGIPFMLDYEHLVYNSAILTKTSPINWNMILDSGGPYLFPAAEDASMDATLMHYLASGGTLFDENDQPRFQIDPLTEVFRFYQMANSQQVIPAAMLQTHSLAESWEAYLGGSALIAHVNATLYLSGRDALLNTAVAPVPGPEKAAPALVSGWHWAIITSDPSHQQLAAELLNWLMAPDNLGVWSYASQWLPASEEALGVWPTDDEYVQFAREQLQSAMPYPGTTYNQVVQPRLAQAVRDVLLGNNSPAAAAAATNP